MPSYPEPEKGYLDQDAELMLAFEALDEISDEQEAEKKRVEDIKRFTEQHFAP